MKALEWLSPVNAVQTRTGWPAPLCERFVGVCMTRPEEALIGALLASLPILGFLIAAGWLADSQRIRDAWALLVLCQLAIYALWGGSMLTTRIVRGQRARRMLPRLLNAPWCLECGYPVPAAQETADIVCPECGEPIPPELAKLAAERGDK